MTIRYAITILTEMQKWRRGEDPYDADDPADYMTMPYTPREFGEAIDVAIERMETEVQMFNDGDWEPKRHSPNTTQI